jgi:hypothetical protein
MFMSKKSTDDARANSNYQTAMTPERLKAMKEALKVAAQIRQDLEGRSHSNSTELIAEDRQR